MSDFLENFHFLRPFWLLAAPALLALWWIIRRSETQSAAVPQGIAPHLANALQVSSSHKHRLLPIDNVLAAGLLMICAVSGPAWTRIPNPLLADTAPLVIAFKMTPSLEQTDLAPSRLDRARFKILDLVDARAGGRTALLAYAGSSHQVAPLTEDANVLRPLIESLTPSVMPREGDAPASALAQALDVLSASDVPGSVLFVLDDFTPSDLTAFSAANTEATGVFFLIATPDNTSLPQLGKFKGAKSVQLAQDDSDLKQIERWINQAYVAQLSGDERLQWKDQGWWLIWPIALVLLIWFRRGWTMRWALVFLAYSALSPNTAHADGFIDWFWTADQQGQRAMNRKDYGAASEVFQNPIHLGYAQMKAGQYEAAAETFGKIDSFDAAMGQGLSLIRNRQYRPAITAFETALQRKPGDQNAQTNLEVAKAILAYVETAREQSDTGEDTGIGADDVVFDNEANRGTDSTVQASDTDTAPKTADQWISSIDTEMSDFLRFRFRQDLTGAEQ